MFCLFGSNQTIGAESVPGAMPKKEIPSIRFRLILGFPDHVEYGCREVDFLKSFYSLTFSGSKTQLYDGFSGKDFIFRKLFKAIGQGRFMCLCKDWARDVRKAPNAMRKP